MFIDLHDKPASFFSSSASRAYQAAMPALSCPSMSAIVSRSKPSSFMRVRQVWRSPWTGEAVAYLACCLQPLAQRPHRRPQAVFGPWLAPGADQEGRRFVSEQASNPSDMTFGTGVFTLLPLLRETRFVFFSTGS